MTSGGLYESLAELDRLLGGEYEQVKHDRGREHALKHLILDEIKKSNLDSEIRADHETPFEEVIRKAHEALGRIRNSQIHHGMHIFGQIPEGEKKVEFINSILRYDDKESMGNRVSIRRLIAEILGLDLDELITDQSRISENGKSNGQRLEEIDSLSKDLIRTFINSPEKKPSSIIREIFTGQNFAEKGINPAISQNPEVSQNPAISQKTAAICERVLDLESRIEKSLEIEALLHGFEGKYIPAGPSGLIMRGRDDVLPTGRNFYSLDPPRRVPTKAAWRVGQQLSGSWSINTSETRNVIQRMWAFTGWQTILCGLTEREWHR